MATSGITIIGLLEMQQAMANLSKQLGPLTRKSIETSTKAAENKAVSTVHVISGKLKGSIGSNVDSDTSGIVFANTEYARAEERRGGPHSYMQPAFEQERSAWPQNYVALLKGVIGGR